MRKVVTVVGTRPELVKFSPVIPLLNAAFDHRLVHSGQHYSYEMDALFFEELHLPAPHYRLEVGSGSHAEQTARILTRFEPLLVKEQPDAVLVLGDTNTTLAGALTAAKLHIPVVHLEAGCRSFNRQMPEELNRIAVDHWATWCFAPGERERTQLLQEGIPATAITVVGSTAIDACLRSRPLAATRSIVADLGLCPDGFLLLTLHRAENTLPDVLRDLLAAFNRLAERWPIVFPIHPRTRAVLEGLQAANPALALHPYLHLIEPVGYLDLLQLMLQARAVLTDSGGIQEEAATLGTPLLIVRPETEWQYLVEAGAAVLIGNEGATLVERAWPWLEQGRAAFRPLDVRAQQGAAKRIVARLEEVLQP